MLCEECGQEMEVTGIGIANHLNPDTGDIDHDADAEHTAYTLEGEKDE
jgi:hypothetical protein